MTDADAISPDSNGNGKTTSAVSTKVPCAVPDGSGYAAQVRFSGGTDLCGKPFDTNFTATFLTGFNVSDSGAQVQKHLTTPLSINPNGGGLVAAGCFSGVSQANNQGSRFNTYPGK